MRVGEVEGETRKGRRRCMKMRGSKAYRLARMKRTMRKWNPQRAVGDIGGSRQKGVRWEGGSRVLGIVRWNCRDFRESTLRRDGRARRDGRVRRDRGVRRDGGVRSHCGVSRRKDRGASGNGHPIM